MTRKSRIGMSVGMVQEGETKFLEIKSDDVLQFEAKSGDTLNYIEAVDMQSGEEYTHFWVSGQLKHNLEKIRENRTLLGLKIEVTHKGQIETELLVEGKMKTCKINQFDIFELQ